MMNDDFPWSKLVNFSTKMLSPLKLKVGIIVGVGTTLGSVENATSDGFEAEQRETMTGDSWRQLTAGAL